MTTHADVATRLVGKLPPGVFAHACRDAVIHEDFSQLNAMLPELAFTAVRVAPDEWQLFGTCGDGSVAAWRVGG